MNIKQIYTTVMLHSLGQLNERIETIEEEYAENIEKVKNFAEKYSVNVEIHEDSTIAYAIKLALGIYVKPKYKHDLKETTAKFQNKPELLYALRDNIHNWYEFLNAEIKKDKITSPKEIGFGEPIKKFANGRCDYPLNARNSGELLVDVVRMVKEMNDKLKPKED